MKKIKKMAKIKYFLLILSVFCILDISIVYAGPDDAGGVASGDPYAYDAPTDIDVADDSSLLESIKQWAEQLEKYEIWEAIDHATAVGYKKALQYFLNELAYNTAEYLATGDEGQNPMFETDNIGDFISDTLDNSAGIFLETLGRENGFAEFNLCEPDPYVKLKIGLGLYSSYNPDKPDCTFSEMKDNWEEALTQDDFLTNFQDMFNPWSNDLGMALTLQTGVIENQQKEVESKSLEYYMNEGIHAVIDPISGKIKTPASVVANQAESTQDKINDNYFVYTGDAVADAISLFANTLIGKLMEKWLSEGLVTNFPDNSYSGNYGGFGNYESESSGGGINDAENRFRSLIEPDFTVRGDYNILNELTTCPDPQNAGPTNCVLNDNFRQAIESNLTVGEAIEQGYLRRDGVFGFLASGLEPQYLEGYPYRSMIILRKFRILPVGWEVAAQKIKEDAGIGAMTLGSLVDCYDEAGEWCEGLVDPNWVLKSPLNYCRREGYGTEIISSQIVGSGYDSELSVGRSDTYCADEQSCIMENDDGTCEAYGYCTEEKRTWNFDADSCDPVYNTCQTFRSTSGTTVSYLENTLEYCDASGVGCSEYATDYNYNASSWSGGNEIYLNNNAETCDSEAEGCHAFIRTKASLGTNLITNSSFENDDDTWNGMNLEIVEDDSYYGIKSAKSVTDDQSISRFIDVGQNTRDKQYTFSFMAKNCSGAVYSMSVNRDASGNCIDGICGEEIDGSNTDWEQYYINYTFRANNVNESIRIALQTYSDACRIDALQLEEVSASSDYKLTTYKDYGQANVVYEKLLPSYLEGNCDDNEDCDTYVQTCSEDSVGCELYTSTTDDISVPAKVSAWDYCDSECVGYDMYIQSETPFDSLREAYFIPDTADTCNAAAVGCDEFTNLDEVDRGGEGIEYYTYLKKCTKPNDNCKEFYIWEGYESGYQLRSEILEAEVLGVDEDGNNVLGAPAVTGDEYDGKICSEETYDPINNPLCIEYRDQDLNIYYKYSVYTVTCSENCYPYRHTSTDETEADCTARNGQWQDNACIYMAIPGEGETCQAAQAGCRKYTGNSGNNLMIIDQVFDFEDGSSQGWVGSPDTVSNVNGGHSLRVSGSTSRTVGTQVEVNNSYVISFIAKAETDTDLSVKFTNSQGYEDYFSGNARLRNNEWSLYELDLSTITHNIDADEKIEIISDDNTEFHIDNIIITERLENYYLIKDSWNTPDSCDQDIEGNAYPLFDLGCDEYTDRDNQIHYLHNFSELCDESEVGCELMIDTHNYSDYNANSWSNGASVLADNYIYVVYDEGKTCNQADKGCQFLGKAEAYEDEVNYVDTYLENNPDKYNEILCDSDQVGCEAWTSNEGTSYFKNPYDQVCEWRQSDNSESYAWYKKKVKRCTTDNSLCSSDSSCGTGTCELEETSDPCPVEDLKTIGLGGVGNAVEQPGDDWAGLCSASQSSCTEYVDPVSEFKQNLIYNGDFQKDVDGVDGPDGWSGGTQVISLEPNTLYILAATNTKMTIDSTTGVFYRLVKNSFDDITNPNNSFWVNSTAGRNSIELYTSEDVSDVTVSVDNIVNASVEVKEAIVEYRLAEEVDKESCNGKVNFSDGCVLFNERSQNGSTTASLIFDADNSVDSPVSVNDPNDKVRADSNVLLKVSPDRVCDKWLACRSYLQDESGNNVCFDRGLCDSLDSKGNCSNFITSEKINQTYDAYDQISDLSGYSKVGYDGFTGARIPSDLYSLGAMEQEGESINLVNGGFEFAGSNGYPLGWSYEGGEAWSENVFKVIDNPIEAQVEGICYEQSDDNCVLYTPEGSNFLRLGAAFSASSEWVDVVDGQDYILTAYVDSSDLSSGSSTISIMPNNGGNAIKTLYIQPGVNEWEFQMMTFEANINQIKILLDFDAEANGNLYVDNIKIKPVLAANSDWNVAQTCRLYPEDNSLSCDYYDDTGARYKGWKGYCLEYDRYPGNENTCLLWYPVDRVKGDGEEDGIAGYSSRYPLYYCMGYDQYYLYDRDLYANASVREAYLSSANCNAAVYNFDFDDGMIMASGERDFKVVEAPENEPANDGCSPMKILLRKYGDSDYSILIVTNCMNQSNALINLVYPDSSSVSKGNIYFYTIDSTYDYTISYSSLNADELDDLDVIYEGVVSKGIDVPVNTLFDEMLVYADNGVSSGCGNQKDLELTSFNIAKLYLGGYCTNLVQTVTPSGQNKYWASRVTEGSDEDVTCYDLNGATKCVYLSDYLPYGAAIVPSPQSNPYEWDSNDNIEGNQPIQYKSENMISSISEVRGGYSYDKNDLQKLFAQSYGAWEWSGNNYVAMDDDTYQWDPPPTTCPDNGRPDIDDPGSYCAILPIINNISIEGQAAGEVEIIKNGFVNLTFNTEVDDDQEPLVMYEIDWGDGEGTIVSGVEMRDRPNPNNPHSLYHLYSYWDLKAKASRPGSGITCGEDYCTVTPSIKIKDNWGWCNNGANNNPCPDGGFVSSLVSVVVREK